MGDNNLTEFGSSDELFYGLLWGREGRKMNRNRD